MIRNVKCEYTLKKKSFNWIFVINDENKKIQTNQVKLK